jgi:hypothetical protein
MITVDKKEGEIRFKIGPHTIPVSAQEAAQLGGFLRTEDIEQAADFKRDITIGPWRIEGAKDDVENAESKSENRRRLLLQHRGRKWHLLRPEAVTLGALFRGLR